MSVRNRPRNGTVKDEDEEITMFNQIRKDLEKLATMQKRQIELADLIKNKEIEIKELQATRKLTVKEHDELSAMYRELLKLSAEENRMLSEEPMDLIRNVEILKALSEATREAPAPPQRAGPGKMRKSKPGPGSQVDVSVDSPAPSPSFSNRLKGNAVRSGSVARDTKDSTAKSDDGNDGAKGLSAEKAGKFTVGAEVAYKQSKPKEDGSQWIQCLILSVTEVGNKKRYEYEVQDPEPDENGTPGDVYRTSAAALIAIPPQGTPLPDYPIGKVVLARYPETTTFYRAEVMGMKKDMYRLKFDDDAGNESEVDKRYVLDLGNR